MQNIKKHKLSAHGSAGLFYYLKYEQEQDDDSLIFHDDINQEFEIITSRWGGALKSCDDIQLENQTVSLNAFEALAGGYSPVNRKELCMNPGARARFTTKKDLMGNVLYSKNGKVLTKETGGRHLGTEITMSAPKDIALAIVHSANISQRKTIIEKHQLAVDMTIRDIYEPYITARRGSKGKNIIATEGCIYSAFTHFSSRPVLNKKNNSSLKCDLQLHDHVLIFGICKGIDKKWGSWDNGFIYEIRKFADEYYKAILYYEMKKLGFDSYKIYSKNNNLDVLTRLSEFNQEIINKFSSRRAGIIKHQNEHGGSTYKANIYTRGKKLKIATTDLFKEWIHEMEKYTSKPPEKINHIEPKSDDEIIKTISLQGNFTELSLMAEVCKQYSGIQSISEIKKKVKEIIKDDRIIKKNKSEFKASKYSNSIYYLQELYYLKDNGTIEEERIEQPALTIFEKLRNSRVKLNEKRLSGSYDYEDQTKERILTILENLCTFREK